MPLLAPSWKLGPTYQQFTPSSGDSVEGSGPIADIGRAALGDAGVVPEHLNLELKDPEGAAGMKTQKGRRDQLQESQETFPEQG